jgi:hypothetical protein
MIDRSAENEFYQKKKANKRTADFEYLQEKYKDASKIDDVEFDYFRTPNNGAVNVTAKDAETGRPLYRARFMPEGDKSKPQAWVMDAMQPPYYNDERFVANKDIFKKMQQDFMEGNIEGGIDAPIKTTKPSAIFGARKTIDYTPFIDAEETNIARIGKKIPSSVPAAVKGQAEESVIDAASRFGKRAGKEVLSALPIVGGVASAALSGDASAGVPLLEEADPVGMSGEQENKMLLDIEERKAMDRYKMSPAGQAATSRVSRGPASLMSTEIAAEQRVPASQASLVAPAPQGAEPQPSRMQGGQAAIPFAEGLSSQMPASPVTETERAPAAAQPDISQPAPISGFQQMAGIEGKIGQENLKVMSDAEMARQQDEQRILQEQEAKKKERDDKVKRIDEMKIEPANFWAKRSTGEKIFAGIGLFFSALTPQGAQNAIKMINDEVDRDIMLQEKNLSKEQGALSQLNKELGDIEAAKSALSVKHLQKLQLELQKNAEKFRGPLAQSKAKIAQEEINRQIGLKQQELMIKLAERQEKNAGKMISLGKFQFRAPTENEAVKFREAYSDAAKAKGALDKLLEIEKKGSKFSIEDSAVAATLARSLQGAIRKEIIGEGAVTEADQRVLDSVVVDPTKWAQLPGSARTRLLTLARKVDEGLQMKAKSLGFTDATDKFAGFKRQ